MSSGVLRHTNAIGCSADDIQEFLEIFLIPFLSTLVVPLNFPELWITAAYMLYVEAMGHSGIRAYWTHPILGKALRLVDMDLCIEDVSLTPLHPFSLTVEADVPDPQHDMHHRKGRAGRNYCKVSACFGHRPFSSSILTALMQATRVWDRVFSSCDERVEVVEPKGYSNTKLGVQQMT